MDNKTLQKLQDIVGEGRVLTDADSLQNYGLDRTTVWTAAPCAVVLPGNIEEVQAIVRLAGSENLAIVTSGGRPGFSGGAVAKSGEVVPALARLHIVSYTHLTLWTQWVMEVLAARRRDNTLKV